jgi:hypothetical protein
MAWKMIASLNFRQSKGTDVNKIVVGRNVALWGIHVLWGDKNKCLVNEQTPIYGDKFWRAICRKNEYFSKESSPRQSLRGMSCEGLIMELYG